MNGSFKVGDKVRYLNERRHRAEPEYYPAPGTVGTVSIIDQEDTQAYMYVQWPEGSTYGDALWWCIREDVEPVTE